MICFLTITCYEMPPPKCHCAKIFNKINLCFYRVNLSDSGDQIKTPIKIEGSWSLPSVNPTTPCTPDKSSLEHSVSIVNLVKASPHEVTHKPMLDLYIRLYSACLDGQSQLWVLCSDAFNVGSCYREFTVNSYKKNTLELLAVISFLLKMTPGIIVLWSC